MSDKKILFRVDASIQIGTGHVRRCLVVAELLKNHGIESIFLCRSLEGHLEQFIIDCGFKVILLKDLPEPPKDKICPYQEQDAVKTTEYMKTLDGVKSVFIDHYSLDIQFETIIKKNTDIKIIVLDDLFNRRHDCDIFIDYLPFNNRDYTQFLPDYTQKYLGLDYLILRNEFHNAKNKIIKHKQNIKKILIFMGGNDPDNITGFVLDILKHADYKEMQIKAVIGWQSPHKDYVQNIANMTDHIEILIQIDTMAEILLWCDIAIGSGGTNTWERLYLNVPSLVFQLADNQKEICAYLANNHLGFFMGSHTELSATKFIKTFTEIIKNPNMLTNMRQTIEKTIQHIHKNTLYDLIFKGIYVA